jgi:putative transposase
LPCAAGQTIDLPLPSRRAGQAELIARIKEIAATRVRYGYRRIHVLLRREGWVVNPKRVYRLYHELGLQLRNKTPKRRVKAKLRDDRRPATRSNKTWAMDFVHDQLATSRKLRVLTIVDTFSRFSPAVEARFSFRGADVVEVLERVGRQGQLQLHALAYNLGSHRPGGLILVTMKPTRG